MKLLVEYTGQLRTAVGRSQDRIEVPDGATVAALLAQLSQSIGESARPHLLTQAGTMQPSLLVAINDTACTARQAASTVLQDGDSVVLLPPIAGG
jgi:molybdopterin converting factor small subunit